ncbi:MAG: orotidine-5'-phosphate decarboxylase [Phycisphaerae bacterium]|nr:orotidine-5'-phosphate decarboxylase [Phycisphaerae bacterium]
MNKLIDASSRTGSLLSAGLEPCEAYLPEGFEANLPGYERFLRTIIDATAGLVAAYKFNLAFFEALGPEGWNLLFRVRRALPNDALVIADAKRGDIGTTAEHYARALYAELNADSATVNPLMGRDSAEPFIAHADKLTFFLVLTSNPGASDFLIPGALYATIARRVASWNTRGNCGAVVGATQPGQVEEIRALMPEVPFLIPGIGAQGGDLEAVAARGRVPIDAGADARSRAARLGLLFHVTRGLLPARGESGDVGAMIRTRTREWNRRIAAAAEGRNAHVDR